jgi:hypothetical protein
MVAVGVGGEIELIVGVETGALILKLNVLDKIE